MSKNKITYEFPPCLPAGRRSRPRAGRQALEHSGRGGLIKVATHPMALLDFLKVRLFLLTDSHSLKATGVESTPRRRLDQIWNHPLDHLCLPFPFREGQN